MKTTIVTIFCFLLFFGCATREDAIRLDNRLSRLETQSMETDERYNEIKHQLEQFGQIRKEEEQDLRSESASLHAQIDRLKEELRILNGKLEEIHYRIDRKIETVQNSDRRLQEMLSFQNNRLTQIEHYLNLEPMKKPVTKLSTPSTSEQSTKQEPEKQLTETELYIAAKQSFDQKEFEKAREGFEKLLKKFPDSGRADNAQFWIGETYYREQWYEKAILEYQKVIENYPNGNKVAAALLKQGFAFLSLGDKPNAKLILEELVKKYPGSNEATVAKQKLTEF
jgi:tol-pal system protein YbgF